jgi:hypothetical protein
MQMGRIQYLLMVVLLLGLVIGLCYTSQAVKKPVTYPELMSKKPKIKEMVSLFLREKDEGKKRKAANKLAELMDKVDTVLVDYDAIRGIDEVEIEVIKADNRPSVTTYNMDSLFSQGVIAKHQPFEVTKDRGSRYLIVYVESWRIVYVTINGQSSVYSLGMGLNVFILDRETESLLYHTGVLAQVTPVLEDMNAVCYELTQQAIEGVRRYLDSLVKVHTETE